MIKSFITKLLSTTLILLMSLSMMNINVISSEEDEPTLDPGVYTFTVPATLNIKGDGNDKLTMLAEWGKGIDGVYVGISSKNTYNLLTDDGTSIEYKFEPGISSSSTYSTYQESFIVLLDECEYAGNYTDILTFEVWADFTKQTVIYHTDGGTLDYDDIEWDETNEVYKQSYTVEDIITLPTNITKEGYTFDGWYKTYNEETKEYSDPITSFSGLTYVDGITVYARWVKSEKLSIEEELPIVEEETLIEEVKEDVEEIIEEVPEEEVPEQEIIEEEIKEEETVPEVVEEVTNIEEAND